MLDFLIGPALRVLAQILVACSLITVTWRNGWARWTDSIEWIRMQYVKHISEPLHHHLGEALRFFWPDFSLPEIAVDYLVLYLLIGSFCVSVMEHEEQSEAERQKTGTHGGNNEGKNELKNIFMIALTRRFKWWHPLVALLAPILVLLFIALEILYFGYDNETQPGESPARARLRNLRTILLVSSAMLLALLMAVLIEGWLFGVAVLIQIFSGGT